MVAFYVQKSTQGTRRASVAACNFSYLSISLLIARCFYLTFSPVYFTKLKKNMRGLRNVYAVLYVTFATRDYFICILKYKPYACINVVNNTRFYKRPKQLHLIQLAAITAWIVRSSINDTLISLRIRSHLTGKREKKRRKWRKAREHKGRDFRRNFKNC